MTDTIKQFRLCCNWFNIGGVSLLATHGSMFFPTAHLFSQSCVLFTGSLLPHLSWIKKINKIKIKKFAGDYFSEIVFPDVLLPRRSGAVSAWLQHSIRWKNILSCLICCWILSARWQIFSAQSAVGVHANSVSHFCPETVVNKYLTLKQPPHKNIN